MGSKIKLLIVDDEDGLRTLLKSEMEAHGFEADEADGGNMALEMLKKSSYDVVILDILMPDISGIKVLRDIRSNKIPTKVIMLTGVNELKLAQESMQLGANDFLTKPVEPRIIADCITRVMKE